MEQKSRELNNARNILNKKLHAGMVGMNEVGGYVHVLAGVLTEINIQVEYNDQ